MSDAEDITAVYAEGFDAEREVLLGDATLALLKRTGQNEDGSPIFELLREVASGYLPKDVNPPDGRSYLQIEWADVDGDISGVLAGADKATHFGLNGEVFAIEEEATDRTRLAPVIWTIRGYAERWTYP